MSRDHTVRSYDQELDLLKSKISEMGKVAEEQLAKAIEALVTKDSKLAVNVIYTDSQVNDLQNAVDRLTVRMLAVRQPMGSDLRHIISALKMATELERIADYAANIAKNGMNLDHVYLEKPVRLIISMAELAIQILEANIYSASDFEKIACLADSLASFNVRSKGRRKNFASMVQESLSRND